MIDVKLKNFKMKKVFNVIPLLKARLIWQGMKIMNAFYYKIDILSIIIFYRKLWGFIW